VTTLLILLAIVALGAILWTPSKRAAELEALYAPPPSQFLETAALRFHIRDTGPRDAPVIIMLRGVASSLHTWEPWAQVLSRTYRVIRYDLPGFGLTGPDINVNYSALRSIAVLSAIMNMHSIRRATLIGNDVGGEMAWQFASRFPERVEKLVLISPCRLGYTQDPKVTRPMWFLPVTLPIWLVWWKLRNAYGDPSRLSGETVRRYRDLMLTKGNRWALLVRIWLTKMRFHQPQLEKVVAPTLVLWGEKDRLVPPSFADPFIKTLPQVSLMLLSGLGHMPQEEDPAASLPPVEAFLARHPPCA
jgi:pimeloyl-ACP methyl ester carboxylesterase